MKVWLSAGLVIAALSVASNTTLAQAPAPVAAAPVRIAVVDINRILARSAAGVAAREQLEKEKAQAQKDLTTRGQELERLREELEKKGSLLSAEARREKQEAFERKERDARRTMDDLSKDLQRKEAVFVQKLLTDLAGVVDRVAKQRGYGLVLEWGRGTGRPFVLYAGPEADLTEEVIRVYDQEAGPKGRR